MDKWIKFVGAAVLVGASIPLLVVLGTAFGALIGWFIGLFFGGWILDILQQLGIHNVTMAQFGAFMGFIGGFVRSPSKGESAK